MCKITSTVHLRHEINVALAMHSLSYRLVSNEAEAARIRSAMEAQIAESARRLSSKG